MFLLSLALDIETRTPSFDYHRYSLTTTTMTRMELKTVQTQATSSFLQRMGFNQNFPRAVVFGPISLGGLEFWDLYVEQGAARILLLLSHVYHKSTAGKMMRIAIDTLQMEAGTSEPLLQ